MKLCYRDATPLVFTFEVPSCEWHCLTCGGWFSLFDCRTVSPTDDMVRLHQHLVDRFASGIRGPSEFDQPAAVPPAEDHIKCDGCGKDSGRTPREGKPSAWYERQDRDGVQRACSRACIDTVAKATGKTRSVLPW